MESTGNETAQPACLLAGSALQLSITEVRFFPQLRSDHVVLAHHKPFGLGDLQELLKIQWLLQARGELRLLARVSEESVELFERHRQA